MATVGYDEAVGSRSIGALKPVLPRFVSIIAGPAATELRPDVNASATDPPPAAGESPNASRVYTRTGVEGPCSLTRATHTGSAPRPGSVSLSPEIQASSPAPSR